MLVSVAAPAGRCDLVVADDVPLADLIPSLVRRCEPAAHPWSRWALSPLGGEPFGADRTLAALGVLDGAELELRDMVAPLATRTEEVGGGVEPDPRRRRITDLAERLVDDVARIRAGNNPLLEYAGPEARMRLRALAPGPFDPAARSRTSDLSLQVGWPRDARAPVHAVAVFTETAGPGGAEPAWSWAAPVVARAHRVTVRLAADPECRYLLDASVEG